MDSKAIASEIVYIKNRLQEREAGIDGPSGPDVDDESKKLYDSMRQLQEELAAPEDSHEMKRRADETRFIQPF